MKRLGILGTFVWDRIWTLEDQAEGRPFETWGGVAYSLAAGAAALPDRWEIVPVAKVGRDLEVEAHAFLGTLPGLAHRSSVVSVHEPNNRVELRYVEGGRRGERLTGGVNGWEWSELAPHLEGLDALYVNFFSGFEFGLEVAERLAREFRGPVYADLHSLFLGCPGAGVREMRALPEWERWLGCFDVVQLNEDERRLLDGAADPKAEPLELLDHGPDAVVVTLGAAGAVFAARGGLMPREGLRPRARLAGGYEAYGGTLPTREVVGGDPTGCGDAWGVTLFTGLLGGMGMHHAIRRANSLAAAKIAHRGAVGLHEHLRRHAGKWADVSVDRV